MVRDLDEGETRNEKTMNFYSVTLEVKHENEIRGITRSSKMGYT